MPGNIECVSSLLGHRCKQASTAHSGNAKCTTSPPVPKSKTPAPPTWEGTLLFAMLIARDTSPLLNLRHLCSLWCAWHSPGSMDKSHLNDSRSDLMHCQYRLSVLQCNSWLSSQERHADHPGSLRSLPCCDPPRSKGSRATHLGELPPPSLTVTTSPSCSTRTRLSLAQQSSPSPMPPQAKTNGVLLIFVVRGLLRRPSVVDCPAVTFCSVHLYNKVAKKRDASTPT